MSVDPVEPDEPPSLGAEPDEPPSLEAAPLGAEPDGPPSLEAEPLEAEPLGAEPFEAAPLGAEPDEPPSDEAEPDEPSVEDLAEQALLELELHDAPKPMTFVDVVVVLPSTNPVVILREVDAPFRELHIPVGLAEGQAISYAARGIPTPKPLTHELFVEALTAFGLAVEVVRITNVAGIAYYADLVLSGNGTTEVIACRPSDGICLALRSILPVPITAAEHVLEEAGILT